MSASISTCSVCISVAAISSVLLHHKSPVATGAVGGTLSKAVLDLIATSPAATVAVEAYRGIARGTVVMPPPRVRRTVAVSPIADIIDTVVLAITITISVGGRR